MRQEVELAADVQRNLTAAISDLEELEQHRNPVLEPIAKKGSLQKVAGSYNADAEAAYSHEAAANTATPPVPVETQIPQSVKPSKAEKDKLHKKNKKQKL